MARMHVNFETNLPDSNEKPTMQVENVTFKTPDGFFVTVGCEGESDFGVKEGLYSARFKGLEYQYEKEGGDTELEYGEEPTDDQLRALSLGYICGIAFYWEKGFNVPEFPTCQKLRVEIEHGGFDMKFAIDRIVPELI